MEGSPHSLFLLQQLNVQREFGFLCDCTVAIGNVYFKAHRAVLAAFSNYFKMIFIHQSSECIKIQPADIQPDVFSFLLHIMYTGTCPKQPVDQSRLQEGIKFLHGYQLCRTSGEAAAAAAADAVRMSNLYGIQISSQLANKDAPGVPKSAAASRGAPGDRGSRSRSQPSLAVGPEGVPSDRQASAPHNVCSVASGDDSDISTRIKQERLEEDEGEEEGPGTGPPAPGQGLPFTDRPLVLLCPRCGQRCSSPEGLREHLFSHALDSALLTEGPSRGDEPDAGAEEGPPASQEPLDAGRLEEALRQSQALASQLALELRRSRGGGEGGAGEGGAGEGGAGEGVGAAPAAVPHSRKRKIACAVCSLRFSHRSQLQEHIYSHAVKPSRYQHLCRQLLLCEGAAEPGGGASAGDAVPSGEAHRDARDNGSSCYSLDSEISQQSADCVPVE